MSKKNKPKVAYCQDCDRWFGTESALKMHAASVHRSHSRPAAKAPRPSINRPRRRLLPIGLAAVGMLVLFIIIQFTRLLPIG